MTRRQQSATVDRLAEIAVELAVRVRDEDPAVNRIWLTHQLPDPRDWYRLAFVLAAGIPVDRPWGELIAWTGQPAVDRSETPLIRRRPERPRGLQPCGTRAAARRHARKREPMCEPCKVAFNDYMAAWKARSEAAA